jgi:outer membrane protein OmpA-like peptidoglycan-associated protein
MLGHDDPRPQVAHRIGLNKCNVVASAAALLSAVLCPRPACTQPILRGSASFVTPVAAPQTQAFGPGASVSGALLVRPVSWLTVGGGATAALLSLSRPSLPEGIAAPTHAGSWLALDALVRVEPRPESSRFNLFAELALSAGLTGARFAPAITPRFGASWTLDAWTVGASIAYWRLFDVIPSVLPGDGQFLCAGLELQRSVSRAPRPRAATAPRAPTAPARPPCPTHAHTLSSDVDNDGCPDGDADGDGIADARDRCRDAAEDRDGFEDDDGCPDPDNDRDAIGDTVDRCPDAPEVVNGVEDDDGCPDESLARVERGRVEYVDQLRFFFNSVRITPESGPVLRDIARLLAAHPEFAVIYVEGHADSIGDEHYNFRLSFLRARAVIDALVRFGVDRSRFVPAGYGQAQPIARGADYWNRALNRRVEFVLDGRRSPGQIFTAAGYGHITIGGHP